MDLDRQGKLAVILADDRQTTLKLFEQVYEQYRSLVLHPRDRGGGNLYDLVNEGIVFDVSDGSSVFFFMLHPQLLSVNFDFKGSKIEIRFDDIIKAIEAFDDNDVAFAFDKHVLRDAIKAIESRDAAEVFAVSKRIQSQVDRFRRAIAVKERIEKRPTFSGVLIEPKNRTKPITKKKAAKLLGREGDESAAVEWLSNCIKDGTIRAEKNSRQSFVFDLSQFPEQHHDKLRPSQGM